MVYIERDSRRVRSHGGFYGLPYRGINQERSNDIALAGSLPESKYPSSLAHAQLVRKKVNFYKLSDHWT